MTATILMIGTTELLLIAGVALLLFGGKKLPELMRGMGQGVKSFKEGLNSPAEDKDENPEADDAKEQDVTKQSSKKQDVMEQGATERVSKADNEAE